MDNIVQEYNKQYGTNYNQDDLGQIIQNLKTLGLNCCLKVLLELLYETVAAKSETLAQKIKGKTPAENPTRLSCSLKAGDKTYKLKIMLCIVDKNYFHTIEAPKEYESSIMREYMRIKGFTVACWNTFKQENPEISAELQNLNIEMTNEINDFYFDKNSDKKISVFSYYTDENDVPLRQKPKDQTD